MKTIVITAALVALVFPWLLGWAYGDSRGGTGFGWGYGFPMLFIGTLLSAYCVTRVFSLNPGTLKKFLLHVAIWIIPSTFVTSVASGQFSGFPLFLVFYIIGFTIYFFTPFAIGAGVALLVSQLSNRKQKLTEQVEDANAGHASG